jgi:ribosomal protein S18 acetylase RimI-like enzyme
LPQLISEYRKTPFTLADGLSEWKGSGFLYIAEYAGKVGGIMRLDEKRNYWGLSSFIVDRNLRGIGIGNKMLNSLKIFDKPVYLNVQQDNPALNLYLRNDFKILEAKNGRYHMKRKTCLLDRNPELQ